MLKVMPKVGDKVRYIGEEYDWLTVGGVYVVTDVSTDGFYYADDDGAGSYDNLEEFDDWELATEEPTPDTASLIANLALRVGELELQNAQQAHEINELYRADAERGVLR